MAKQPELYHRKPILAGWSAAAAGGILAFAAVYGTAPAWVLPAAAVLLPGGLAALLIFAVWPLYLADSVLREMEAQYAGGHAPVAGASAEEMVRARLEQICALARDAARQEYSALILEKQVALSSLQSQINPHFLYNTLEAIRGKAILEEVPDVAKMAEALAGMFRYSISRRGDMASLEDELRNIQNYMLIQQYRFNNKFRLILQMDCERDCLLRKIPRMTLQPIVENAIYHGLEMKMGEGLITIDVTETDQRLVVTVHDNGIGMDEKQMANLRRQLRGEEEAAAPSSGGIALVNVNRRLQLCFGRHSGLRIYSTRGVGTDVEINLPAGESDEKRNAAAGTAGGQ